MPTWWSRFRRPPARQRRPLRRGRGCCPRTAWRGSSARFRHGWRSRASRISGRRLESMRSSSIARWSPLHFRKDIQPPHPRVLLVAPLAGHFATLLRGTVATMLAEHDVYITDWHNARDVPLADGPFGFDDFVGHL